MMTYDGNAKEKLLPLNYFEIVPVCLVCYFKFIELSFESLLSTTEKLIMWRFRLLKRQRNDQNVKRKYGAFFCIVNYRSYLAAFAFVVA